MNFNWDDPAVTEQEPINQSIVEELREFIPASWSAAELRLGFSACGGVAQQVVNPDTAEGWTVSHRLAITVLRLARHRRKFGLGWQTVVYVIRLTDSGEWQASASFE
ncbi:MAG: hypothetical protein ACP5XB_32105 [Isosphaeraceae bacterium]